MADSTASDATTSTSVVSRLFGGLRRAAAATASFPDQALEAAVREQLSMPTGDITSADMEQLTSLSAPEVGIADLTGLQSAVNLTDLGLYGNRVSKLEPLHGLTALTDLTLSGNPDITDVAPLSGLKNLRVLDLSSDNVTDITGLGGLSELVFLDLSDNRLTDVHALGSLSKASDLVLFRNSITDIAPLQGLTGLESLDLTDNLLDVSDGSSARTTIDALVAAGVDVTYDPQSAVEQPPLVVTSARFSGPIGYDLKSLLKTTFTVNVNQDDVGAKLTIATSGGGIVTLFNGTIQKGGIDEAIVTWDGKVAGKRLPPASYDWTLTLSKTGLEPLVVKGKLLISNITFVINGIGTGKAQTYPRYMIKGSANCYISSPRVAVRLTGPSRYNQSVWSGGSGTSYLRGTKALKTKGTYTFSMTAPVGVSYYMSVVQ